MVSRAALDSHLRYCKARYKVTLTRMRDLGADGSGGSKHYKDVLHEYLELKQAIEIVENGLNGN